MLPMMHRVFQHLNLHQTWSPGFSGPRMMLAQVARGQDKVLRQESNMLILSVCALLWYCVTHLQ